MDSPLFKLIFRSKYIHLNNFKKKNNNNNNNNFFNIVIMRLF